jgi:hypothetical protein
MATNRDFASPSKNSRNKIRRPINAFLLYGNEIRPQLKRDNPGVKHLDISKILGNMWRELSQEIKNEYMERARIIRENHKTQNPGMKWHWKVLIEFINKFFFHRISLLSERRETQKEGSKRSAKSKIQEWVGKQFETN